jgi:uncharacterized protein YprB with RNaseH-like and TPR domain
VTFLEGPSDGRWDLTPVLARVRAAFAGVRLAERYDVAVDHGELGDVVVVTQPCDVAVPALPLPEVVRSALDSRLELVHGVGPIRAAALRAGGVRSVSDLAGLPAYSDRARPVCDEWDADDLVAVGDRLKARLAGRGHLLGALLAGCVRLEEIAFLDVETLGLSGNAIFLSGIGRFRDASFVVEQYLAPSYADEPAMLARLVREIARARLVVTYNGRTADIPWIRSRCFFHGLVSPPELAHVDLVYGTRRQFVHDAEVLTDARLPTVQHELLGLLRPGHDVPSMAVPELYQEYVATANEGMLVPVIEHNRSDLEALVVLLDRLCVEALGACS